MTTTAPSSQKATRGLRVILLKTRKQMQKAQLAFTVFLQALTQLLQRREGQTRRIKRTMSLLSSLPETSFELRPLAKCWIHQPSLSTETLTTHLRASLKMLQKVPKRWSLTKHSEHLPISRMTTQYFKVVKLLVSQYLRTSIRPKSRVFHQRSLSVIWKLTSNHWSILSSLVQWEIPLPTL